MEQIQIKSVKDASFVDPSPSSPSSGKCPQCCRSSCRGLLQKFWQVLATKGSSPRVVWILRGGYSLKFKIKLLFTKKPLIRSRYANLLKNSHLKKELHSLLQKTNSGKGKNLVCSGILQPTVSCSHTKRNKSGNPSLTSVP